MRVIALSPVDPGLPGFNVSILCTYDITGDDAMYPHSSVTSFPDLQCKCGKCAASKLDQQEETSNKKTRKLHTIVQTFGTDLRYMMFGSMTSPALMRFLNGKGYTSLEQMLGYSSDIDENNEWNLRSYLHPDRKKNGPAAPACDSDHCVWRLMGVLVCHSIYALLPCAHATNIVHDYVREQCNDRCFWLSRIPNMSDEKQAAKEAADQLAAAKSAEKQAAKEADDQLAAIKRAEKQKRAAPAKEAADQLAAIKRAEKNEKPIREAATAERAKGNYVDAARDKREAVKYLKDNKEYKARFMATSKDNTITKAVSAFKKWSKIDANSKQTRIHPVRGVTQRRKKWQVMLSFAGLSWTIGTYETIQIANSACTFAREIVGEGLVF